MDDGMDSLFSTFMSEVTNLKSKKRQQREEQAGSPEEIVERLTSRSWEGCAYAALQLSLDASESEVTKQYRKMSVLIHPDKCSLEKASDAFQVLSKAYADTKDPAYQDKYRDIVGEARSRVRKRIEKENKEREKRGEDPLDTQGNDFDREVLQECERMTTESAEDSAQKNEVLEANMKRMAENAKEASDRKRQAAIEKKVWDKQRDKRVAGWQTFMNNVKDKKFKTGHVIGKIGAADALTKIEERREEDTEKVKAGRATVGDADAHMDGGYRKEDGYVPMGVDKSYKKQWR